MFTSRAGAIPASTKLSGIAIAVDGLSTVHEEGKPYTLNAAGENGGQLKWLVISIPRAYSEGTLVLKDIELRPLWQFAEDRLAFELADGRASIEGRYRVDWNNEIDYRVTRGEIRLRDIAILPQAPQVLTGHRACTGQPHPGRGGTGWCGPACECRVAGGGGTGHKRLERGRPDQPGAAVHRRSARKLHTADVPPAATNGGDTKWTAELGSLELKSSSLRWRSEYTDPPLLEELRWKHPQAR